MSKYDEGAAKAWDVFMGRDTAREARRDLREQASALVCAMIDQWERSHLDKVNPVNPCEWCNGENCSRCGRMTQRDSDPILFMLE